MSGPLGSHRAHRLRSGRTPTETATSKIVQIFPTTRHEGRSKLVLRIDDEGLVERGEWLSITPVRGIERLSIGKSMDQVPKIASHVCGICPVAHLLAGIEAMEASIGCTIPEDARILRLIMQSANRLNSHALHSLMILPDLYIPGTETKINPFSPEEPFRMVARRIQRLREIGQEITQIASGMYTNVTHRARAKMLELAKEAVPLTRDHAEFMIALLRDFQRREIVRVGDAEVALRARLGYHSLGYMATDPVYGTSSLDATPGWDLSRCREATPLHLYSGAGEITSGSCPIRSAEPRQRARS